MRTPRLCPDWPIGFPDYIKLTIFRDFADNHRFMQVVVLGIHRDFKTGRRLDRLASDGLANSVDVSGTRLFNRLSPHLDPYIGGFHGVIGDPLVPTSKFMLFHIRSPFFDESFVFWSFDGHEVIPGCQVPH